MEVLSGSEDIPSAPSVRRIGGAFGADRCVGSGTWQELVPAGVSKTFEPLIKKGGGGERVSGCRI